MESFLTSLINLTLIAIIAVKLFRLNFFASFTLISNLVIVFGYLCGLFGRLAFIFSVFQSKSTTLILILSSVLIMTSHGPRKFPPKEITTRFLKAATLTMIVFFLSFLNILYKLGFGVDMRLWQSDDWLIWAAMPKEIAEFRELPNGESGIFFRNFFPGIFIYNAVFGGSPWTENFALVSYYFLIFVTIAAIGELISTSIKGQIISFSMISFLTVISFGYGMLSLTVNQYIIVASIYLGLLAIKSDLRPANLIALVIGSAALTMTKQSGILHVIIVSLLLILGQQIRIKKKVLYSVLIFAPSVILYLTWRQWVNINAMNGLFMSSSEGFLTSLISIRSLNEFDNFLRMHSPFVFDSIKLLWNSEIGLPISYLDQASRMPYWQLVAVSAVFLLVIYKLRSRQLLSWKKEFSIFAILQLCIVAWSAVIGLLESFFYSSSSMNGFTQHSRYVSDMVIILYAIWFVRTLDAVQLLGQESRKKVSSPRARGLVYASLLALVFILPKPSFGIFPFSKTELEYSSGYMEFFDTFAGSGLDLQRDVSICSVEELPESYIMRLNYLLVPAHLGHRFESVPEFVESKVDCRVLVVLCEEECSPKTKEYLSENGYSTDKQFTYINLIDTPKDRD